MRFLCISILILLCGIVAASAQPAPQPVALSPPATSPGPSVEQQALGAQIVAQVQETVSLRTQIIVLKAEIDTLKAKLDALTPRPDSGGAR